MPRVFTKPAQEIEPRLLDRLEIRSNEPVELAVWAVKKTTSRCKLLPAQLPVTLKTFRDELEGEIIKVMPAKV